MAVKTFTVGEVLTAADLNDYLMKQVVGVVTSGSRPTGIEGRSIFETDTNMARYYNGAAWRSIVNARPSASLVKGTTSINNNTVTTITWDSAIKDEFSMWDSGDSIVVPYDGLYMVFLSVRFASQATAAGIRQARIDVDGNEQMTVNMPAASNLNATNVIVQNMHPMVLSAGADIQFKCYQNSGGALNIVANTRCAVWLVSEGT